MSILKFILAAQADQGLYTPEVLEQVLTSWPSFLQVTPENTHILNKTQTADLLALEYLTRFPVDYQGLLDFVDIEVEGNEVGELDLVPCSDHLFVVRVSAVSAFYESKFWGMPFIIVSDMADPTSEAFLVHEEIVTHAVLVQADKKMDAAMVVTSSGRAGTIAQLEKWLADEFEADPDAS